MLAIGRSANRKSKKVSQRGRAFKWRKACKLLLEGHKSVTRGVRVEQMVKTRQKGQEPSCGDQERVRTSTKLKKNREAKRPGGELSRPRSSARERNVGPECRQERRNPGRRSKTLWQRDPLAPGVEKRQRITTNGNIDIESERRAPIRWTQQRKGQFCRPTEGKREKKDPKKERRLKRILHEGGKKRKTTAHCSHEHGNDRAGGREINTE